MEDAPLNLTLLARALERDPTSFEFFAAVRHLERLAPNRRQVGQDADPSEEVVRFSVNPRLGYPASEIQDLSWADGSQPRMTVNFMGLTGPSGVLPYEYSEMVIRRLLERDTALAAFLDIFHHRIISLFYQAWRKHRFTVRYESEGADPLTHHLLDLAGLGPEAETPDDAVPRRTLAQYAGLLGPMPRSAAALEDLLADYFDVPVVVAQFVGGWYPIDVPDQCALDEGGPAESLGLGAVVGDEVWDTQGRIRIRIGPLPRARYESFLPGSADHTRLRDLVRLYCHDQFAAELQLVLEADAVPGVQLGDPGAAERLGWSTWITSSTRTRHGDETVLMLVA